jgi:hypothetical protein
LRGCNVGITDGMVYKLRREMGSCAMIYVPSFINIGSGIQKFMGGRYRKRQQDDLISLILLLQNKQSMLKTIVLPFVLHGSETWSLKSREEDGLRAF